MTLVDLSEPTAGWLDQTSCRARRPKGPQEATRPPVRVTAVGAHGGHGLSLKLAARTARPTGLVEPVRSGRPERPDARPAGAGPGFFGSRFRRPPPGREGAN